MIARLGAAAARRSSRLVALCAVAGVALLLAPPVWSPRLVWNLTPSVPVGLYQVVYGRPARRGDLVLAWAPAGARRLADERGYLPNNVPLVKPVAALAGDRVCGKGPNLEIDPNLSVARLVRDRAGRPLPWWSECRRLLAGEVLLIAGSAPNSYDSRYFGPVGAQAVIGVLIPLARPAAR